MSYGAIFIQYVNKYIDFYKNVQILIMTQIKQQYH